ncbi:MFS transporter [Janthinobacterium sp. SUN176]|uniref:MFS transporter n=1 Tax=Janthinobacterium sp. SUN176 TaxID=3014788 RepID=UPI0027126EB6|nr:MFS transporter [Janthinobacterium sp. SUN176]MDO8071259.1 MFS transporter [Janthinobacterium sp. SUN176]
MDLAASTIVNVGGPALIESLGASSAQMQWVIGGYALALGAGLVLGGRLGDRYGRRAMFLYGLAAFTIASLLCAVAPTIALLIVFRLLQGLAGAMLLPQGLGLLRENYQGPALAKVFGIFGPILGLAGILGPVLGGMLLEANVFGLGWRAMFLINIPIGIACFLVAYRYLPHRPGDRSVHIDVPGASLLVLSSVFLVLPLGEAGAWPAWGWPMLAMAVLGFGLFGLRQSAMVRAGQTPLIMTSIFQRSAYTAGLAGIALFFCSLVGMQLVLTLFLQIGHGLTAGEASIANLPFAVGTACGATLSGAVLAARFGRKVLQLGAGVQLAGVALLQFELGNTAVFSAWHVVPGMLVCGIGAGLVIAALFSIILASLDNKQIGSGSGVLSAVQSIAASIGVALFSGAFFAAHPALTPDRALSAALTIQTGILIAFMGVTFFFPTAAKSELEVNHA